MEYLIWTPRDTFKIVREAVHFSRKSLNGVSNFTPKSSEKQTLLQAFTSVSTIVPQKSPSNLTCHNERRSRAEHRPLAGYIPTPDWSSRRLTVFANSQQLLGVFAVSWCSITCFTCYIFVKPAFIFWFIM